MCKWLILVNKCCCVRCRWVNKDKGVAYGTGINNVGQSGLSYIDQLKSLQENKKTEESTGKQDLKQEDFLSLLTKQLSQQDPFKPVSNDQMIAQMASFATVDGIGKMNSQFESLNSSMTSNQALQASSLVGRDVLVPGAAGVKQDNAAMAAMVKLAQPIDNLFVRVENEAGQLVRTFEVGAKPAGDTRVLWDGNDENGNPMPAGKYNVKASGLVEGGVSRVPSIYLREREQCVARQG